LELKIGWTFSGWHLLGSDLVLTGFAFAWLRLGPDWFRNPYWILKLAQTSLVEKLKGSIQWFCSGCELKRDVLSKIGAFDWSHLPLIGWALL
jgi:hypothetical protein